MKHNELIILELNELGNKKARLANELREWAFGQMMANTKALWENDINEMAADDRVAAAEAIQEECDSWLEIALRIMDKADTAWNAAATYNDNNQN